MQTSQITIQNLSYKTPDDKSIFEDLTLSFGAGKVAIIGKNGSGKTTLVKLISGELIPNFGSVNHSGTIAVCPQNLNAFIDNTVADVFDATEKLNALEKIIAGSVDEKDFTILDDDWSIENRIQEQLREFGLKNLDLKKCLNSLSGGEVTRLWLAKVFATDADFLILDEPTNNLDIVVRKMLYEKIKTYRKSIIVISHDRRLLEFMQQIVEISVGKVKTYGGNYKDYLEQKNKEQAAKARQLTDAKQTVQKTKQSIQKTKEKQSQRESQGVRLRKSGSQAKIILDAMKQSATKNQGKLATREDQMLERAQKKLDDAKANVEISKEFRLVLPKTKVPSGKMVVCFEQVCFSYDDTEKPIINNFDLTIAGPKRIAIVGENGSGKSTLVKLIAGQLTPTEGKITRGVENIKYLDQQASLLNPEFSILDNFKMFNPQIKETEARSCLAQFLFRNQDALKQVANLSNGEKTRVLLACILMAQQPPQLLILDEPTNHLDLTSIAAIEGALNCYQGALILISHDEVFTNNIAITEMIQLPDLGLTCKSLDQI